MKFNAAGVASKIGAFLAVVSISIVFYRLWIFRADIIDWKPAADQVALAAACVGAYSICWIFPTFSWHTWLRLFGMELFRFRSSFFIYSRSQLAKYIPGNIFHFTGRHVLSRNEGIPHAVLLAALMSEITGLIIVATVIIAAGGLAHRAVPFFSGNIMTAVSVCLVGAVLVLQIVLPARLSKKSYPVKHYFYILYADIFYLFFMAGTGLIFYVTVYALSGGETTLSPADGMSIFAIAWLAGFITPGAPAGLGVREIIMITLLQNYTGPGTGLLAVSIFRFVTVCGDAVFFLVSFPWKQYILEKE